MGLEWIMSKSKGSERTSRIDSTNPFWSPACKDMGVWIFWIQVKPHLTRLSLLLCLVPIVCCHSDCFLFYLHLWELQDDSFISCWGHSIVLKCHEFNALLALASRRGHWYEAIELLIRAPSLRVTPDIATWKLLSNVLNMFQPVFFSAVPLSPGRLAKFYWLLLISSNAWLDHKGKLYICDRCLCQRPCTLADSLGQTAKFANWASSKCLSLWCSHQCCCKSIRN